MSIAKFMSTESKKGRSKVAGENKHPKDKFMYKERSYEALIRQNNQQVDLLSMQNFLSQNRNIKFMN